MKPARSIGPWLVTIGLLVVATGLLARGHRFYALDVAARVEHPDYRTLSPSGLVGHGYGMVGTALMLTNLLYLVRRRFPRWPVGSMKAWLDLHVFTGLAGALFVLFHSAFQLRTPLASASSYSVLFVVVTGIVGRYLVALVPRADAARMAASLAALERGVPGLRARMSAALGEHTISEPTRTLSLLGAAARVPRWLREARERRAIVRERFATEASGVALAAEAKRELELAAEAVAEEAGRQVHTVAARALLAPWRQLHRLFAVLLVASVTVHIGVAWHYGFRWIFSD